MTGKPEGFEGLDLVDGGRSLMFPESGIKIPNPEHPEVKEEIEE